MFEVYFPITTGQDQRRPGMIHYYFQAGPGLLEAGFKQQERRFTIYSLDIDESFRCRGIGKGLLRAAWATAEELDARYITALITSRESLQAMRSVFGKENIRVREEGFFQSERELSDGKLPQTRATLDLIRDPSIAPGTFGYGTNEALDYSVASDAVT